MLPNLTDNLYLRITPDNITRKSPMERHDWDQIVSRIIILTGGASECRPRKIPEATHKSGIIYCIILIVIFLLY